MKVLARGAPVSTEPQSLATRLTAARASLLVRKPLYYSLLRSMEERMDPDLPYAAAVGWSPARRQVVLSLNPRLLEPYSVEDLAILLEHEVLHVCFHHLFAVGPRDDHAFNLACDYVVNANIPELNARAPELLDPECPSPWARSCLPAHLTPLPELGGRRVADMSALEVYRVLCLYLTVANVLITIDGHSLKVSDPEGRDPIEPLSGEAQSILDRLIIRAAEELRDSQGLPGNLPGALRRRLGDILPARRDWRPILRQFAASVASRETERTWTRISRRYPRFAPGKRRRAEPRLVILLDCSGSVWGSPRALEAFAGEIRALQGECRALTLVVGDTEERLRVDLKRKTVDEALFELQGGGGTDLQFGWDAARELGANGVICHTDGEIPKFDPHGIRTVFFILPTGRAVSGYPCHRVRVD